MLLASCSRGMPEGTGRIAAKNRETDLLLSIRRTLYPHPGLRRIVPPDQLLLPAPTTPPRLAPGEEVPNIFTPEEEGRKEESAEGGDKYEEVEEEKEIQEDSDTEPPSPVVKSKPPSRLLKPKAEVRRPQPKSSPRDAKEGYFAVKLKEQSSSSSRP